jgi:uncharacterized membrane protein
MIKKIMRFLGDNFFAGIVVILPITITVVIIRFLVVSLNSIMLNPLAMRLSPYLLQEQQRLFFAKTVVFIAAFIIIILIGLMTRVIIVRRTFSFFEKFLYKLPMVNKVYGALKEISNALFSSKKSSFKKVILAEYPRKGIYTIGFITSESKGILQDSAGEPDLISVYIPTTPNPTSGLFVLLNKNEVKPLQLSVEEAFKVVISAGAITPPSRTDKRASERE